MKSFDVAIIGGGPAGSTCGTFLKMYLPRLSVAVFERELFPRDHVGESQLPLVSYVLHEMGVWDKVEQAGFPIKIGATYRWGTSPNLWDFEFLPNGALTPEPRPAKFEGQRRYTAFQVDRAIYDKILLDHARKLGVQVHESTVVRQVNRAGDRIESLTLGDGTEVRAKHYVDASGHVGLLRRAMGVKTTEPTTLQNIAIWDYWQNADWAVSIGVEGTRVQVLSLGYGWIWFIPLGPTRTSIGLIVPAEYYKASGMKPSELYRKAMQEEPLVRKLTANAASEGKFATTKDWSFLADRLAGENWFLAGESAGFADPILAAGMTLAHVGAKQVAYGIIGIERGEHDAAWIKEWYDTNHRERIHQHIRFADYWYTANGQFRDLQEHAARIARDVGLDLEPTKAWQWLGTGGFVDEEAAGAGVGAYHIAAVHEIAKNFAGKDATWAVAGKNRFRLNLEGVEKTFGASLANGSIERFRVYQRGPKKLPRHGFYELISGFLRTGDTLEHLHQCLDLHMQEKGIGPDEVEGVYFTAVSTLEAMVQDGWVMAEAEPGQPGLDMSFVNPEIFIHENRDSRPTIATTPL